MTMQDGPEDGHEETTADEAVRFPQHKGGNHGKRQNSVPRTANAVEEEASKPSEGDSLPMRKIAALWDWLPAFRAVAETENLRRAATFLALSPPALSRTLKLLEDHLGTPLFVREGRSLRLTEPGRRLLAAVRSAMRAVDDALSPSTRALRVHTLPALAPIVVRALAPHGPLSVSTRRAKVEDLLDELTRGELDLVVTSSAHATSVSSGAACTAAPLCEIPVATYGEARAGRHRVSVGDAWPFACLEAGLVALEVDDFQCAIEGARQGLVVTLPCVLAPADLEAQTTSSLMLWSIHRNAVGGKALVGPVAEARARLVDYILAGP